MRLVGADLGLLSQLVTKLGGQDRSSLDDALTEMNGLVQDSKAYWIGDYADGFRANFARFTANVGRDLEQVLAHAAQITGQNLTAIAKATGETDGQAGDAPGGALGGTSGSLAGAGAADGDGKPDAPGGSARGYGPGAARSGAGGSPSAGGLPGAGAAEAGRTLLSGAGSGPVSQARVSAAIAYFNQNINATEPRFGGRFDYADIPVGAQDVLQDWQKLSPADLNAVLGSLTPQQLQELNGAANQAGPAVQQELAQLILKEADLGTIQRIESGLPDVPLEPSLPHGSNLTYQPIPSGTSLFGNGIEPNSQVNQGDLGDCYFLSSLAAVAAKDPAFIQSHIKENANGTYTVTLYQNGKPVAVTVSPDLPANSDGNDAYDQIPADGALYVALYEKAYAQLQGGYGTIGDGGDPKNALATITGQPTTEEDWQDSNTAEEILTLGFGGHGGSAPSLASIQALLASGQPVTAWTTNNDVWPDGDKNDPIEVVGDHAYRVESVTTNPQTGQAEITLVNPWGQDGTGQAVQFVTLTQQQFSKYFDGVAW
jgi:uncharacterized protein YukE